MAASTRRTATALLTTEAALLHRMRAAVDTIAAQHFTTDARTEAIFARINQAAAAMQRHLPAVVAAGRTDARNAGLRALHADADRLRKALVANGEPGTLPELPPLSDSLAADAERGRSTAMALAGAWHTAATGAIVTATAGTTMRAVTKAANAAVAHNIERIAANENAHAFNDERTRAAHGIAQAAGLHLRREWNAILDDRTCDVCGALDGVVRWDHEPFGAVGSSPPVHPHCRCFVTESWHPRTNDA